LKVLEGHYTWLQQQKTARADAKRLTTMTVTEYRDEGNETTSLTRDGEMSLSLLPLRADGVLLDGARIADLDERDRPEAMLLDTVPAPESWSKLLAGFDKDEEGRIELLLEEKEPGCWADETGRFRYSVAFGLEKETPE
jgi:CRISPR-associated endonuclease/helicase Cas3